MVTVEQLSYFQKIYDQEMDRCGELVNRGKLYLSVVTLYMGLLGVAANKVVPNLGDSGVVVSIYLLGFALFSIALVFIVKAIGIYQYVYPSDPETILKSYDTKWPDNERFFLERIAELSAAFKYNHPLNEKRASYLKLSSWLMVSGVICQAFILASLTYNQ